MLQSRFEDIMEQIIKDVISSQVILQFTKLGHDLLQELDKESLALFNSSFSISFGLGNNIFNGGLHLFKSILDNRLSFSNLGLNNSFELVQEVNNISLYFTRFNLGFELIENILDVMSNLHDISNGKIFNILVGNQRWNQIAQMLLDDGDQTFNGLTESRLQDIGEKVIKNVVSSQVILQFSQFGHDFFQKFNQKTLSLFNSSFNVSLSLGNHFINSSIHLFKSILNNSLKVVQEVHNVSLHFARGNLGFELIENIFDVLSNLHDISDGHVFSRLQLVNKVSKMLTDGGDQVFNGMLQSRFENIMEQIIKDVISSQ